VLDLLQFQGGLGDLVAPQDLQAYWGDLHDLLIWLLHPLEWGAGACHLGEVLLVDHPGVHLGDLQEANLGVQDQYLLPGVGQFLHLVAGALGDLKEEHPHPQGQGVQDGLKMDLKIKRAVIYPECLALPPPHRHPHQVKTHGGLK